jgi:hypothetical protein
MQFKKKDCADSSVVANPKYMGIGMFSIVYDIYWYIAAEKGYRYHFGIGL